MLLLLFSYLFIKLLVRWKHLRVRIVENKTCVAKTCTCEHIWTWQGYPVWLWPEKHRWREMAHVSVLADLSPCPSLCVFPFGHPLSYLPLLFWLKSSKALCGPWAVDQAPPPPLCRLKTKRTFQGVEEMFWEQGNRDGWFPCRGGADSNRSFLSSHVVGFQCHVKPSRHLTLTSAHSSLIYLA